MQNNEINIEKEVEIVFFGEQKGRCIDRQIDRSARLATLARFARLGKLDRLGKL